MTVLLLLLLAVQEGRTVGGVECYDGYLISRDKGVLWFQLIGREIDDKWEVEDETSYFLNGNKTELAKFPSRPCYVVTVWEYRGLNAWRLLQVRAITRYERR